MSDKTNLGVRILAAALMLGVLGDALLRAGPWGINASLWVTALAATIVAVDWPPGAWHAPKPGGRYRRTRLRCGP